MDKEPKHKSRKETDQDIDDQVKDSFPASDPPSYTASKGVGRPERKGGKQPEKRKRSTEAR